MILYNMAGAIIGEYTKYTKSFSVHTKELKVSSRWWFWVDLEGSVAVG